LKGGKSTTALLILGLLGLPDLASSEARPRPGARTGGFRLYARALGALTVNRVYCGLTATGEICRDSTGSGFAGGGFWPKGTANQYVFNSGFQLAGVIDRAAGFEWAGDTSSATFYNPAGGGDGEPVRPIHNAGDPVDLAGWPAAAWVPKGDASEELFSPLLRERRSASQGDVWWLSWDGNAALASPTTRQHPLGVLLEQRGMGWNFPAGNEDILYFIYTIYNITSTDPAAYAAVRPAMRDILLEKARDFHRLNNQRYGLQIPDDGYAIQDLYVAFAADMDVGDAGLNYASVNLPFALGYTYDRSFSPLPDWTFDPGIFGPPFFAGTGFVGVKFLQSPLNQQGEQLGLTLFGTTVGGGSFEDPSSAEQLYRYFSATLNPALGDSQCNTGNPRITRICFLNNAESGDMRFFQSSGPLTLTPGASGSIVVAYIFAAPVKDPACEPPCAIRPEDPTILTDAGRIVDGVNAIDRLSGYLGFSDANDNGQVEQEEFEVVPGSLLGKARVAQAVFDGGFLLPFAPEPSPFFLIPGDNQVTVLWQPSPSEKAGDPFFTSANLASITPPGGGAPVPNPLYDPNYRQNDVEGYRVYRGRVDSPNSLQLLAQFDYAGTLISDYQGQVNPVPACAPEIGIDAAANPATGIDLCDYDTPAPGAARVKHVDVPLVGPVVQVRLGRRAALATGEAILLGADTAVTGQEGGCLRSGNPAQCDLRDTGVPFVYVDETARNNLRYFYAVTAFDINSFQSGPSSLESPRVAKPVTPVTAASNYQNTGEVAVSMRGRGAALDNTAPVPTIDPGTGRFSGPFPPANDFDFGLGNFVQELIAGPGTFSLTLDSIGLGSAHDNLPSIYHFTAASGGNNTLVSLPILQDQTVVTHTNSTSFPAISPDASLAQRYGGNDQYKLTARMQMNLQGLYYTNAWGRGCVNSAPGFAPSIALRVEGCEYNGQRWFDGPSPETNETVDHPQATHPPNATTNTLTGGSTNAGALSGVANIYIPHSYETLENVYRNVEGALAGVQRAADFNVYWGAGGLVDSVIDVTHNVAVQFSPVIGSSYGILNASASAGGGSKDGRSDVLTNVDMGCVEPWRSFPSVGGSGGIYGCTAPTAYALSQTAIPGPVAFVTGSTSNAPAAAAAPRPGAGFILYLPGTYSVVELAGGALPAAGAVWSLRSYVGSTRGGQGAAGDRGPYTFTPRPRPLTATGVSLQVDFDVINQQVAATETDLEQIHTVPDPYYVTNAFERTTQGKVIKFVNLPAQAIIRIYSSSGILVDLLEHRSETFGGAATWNVLNRNNHVVGSGVYFYHIESGGARRVGRMTIVNFAE
jgi:hypothetical protein